MAGRPFLALVSLLAAVLVGCSDAESDDDPPPEPTGTPTSEVRESADVPTPSDAARKDTLKGAEAFVRHYIDLLNYASDTGDTTPLKAASAANCNGCNDYAHLYKRTYENGGYFRKGDWIVQRQVIEKRHEGAVRVVITVDTRPGRYRKNRSTQPRSYGSNQYSLTFVVDQESGHWIVREFDGNET